MKGLNFFLLIAFTPPTFRLLSCGDKNPILKVAKTTCNNKENQTGISNPATFQWIIESTKKTGPIRLSNTGFR